MHLFEKVGEMRQNKEVRALEKYRGRGKRKERGKENEERKDIHMYSRYKRRDLREDKIYNILTTVS